MKRNSNGSALKLQVCPCSVSFLWWFRCKKWSFDIWETKKNRLLFNLEVKPDTTLPRTKLCFGQYINIFIFYLNCFKICDIIFFLFVSSLFRVCFEYLFFSCTTYFSLVWCTTFYRKKCTGRKYTKSRPKEK